MEIIEPNIKLKPFLRWAGGKTWLLKSIHDFLPERINNYFEPFLGGASVFIHLKQNGLIKNKAYLSDQNEQLINAYNVLKKTPNLLMERLDQLENNKEVYYKIRNTVFESELSRAAQFIFLNRTSFNGIYRENLKGEYNVPYGNKIYKDLYNFENLKGVSNLLKNTTFQSHDFIKIKTKVKKGDFVFLDPPYTVAHQHNGFVKYNQKIFLWEDQIKLKSLILHLIEKDIKFILTNASHKSIDDLYKNVGKHYYLKRASVIGGKNATRDTYEEILITNV
ncbi:MAG TPA: Dam family site-specific DNA-(adenine-N6)-methyltransferase [Fluviicola sp.]|nr:Dam family site-specific DNA-(adenine-N6)-methyltransferase [Fluviicola sp.]